jgi:hypothetical protein
MALRIAALSGLSLATRADALGFGSALGWGTALSFVFAAT